MPRGALAMMPYRHPEMIAANGKVSIKLKKIQPKTFQLAPRKSPLHRPTPKVAPVMDCVVGGGIPRYEAKKTVMEALNSMEKPREGE